MCAARFARRIAALVSATLPALSGGTRALATPTTPRLSADGCNGAQITAGAFSPQNTATLTTPGWIYSRAPKATDKACIQAYHAKHEELSAELIRRGV